MGECVLALDTEDYTDSLDYLIVLQRLASLLLIGS